MVIYTSDKQEIQLPDNTCWIEPPDQFAANQIRLIMPKGRKIVSLYYENENRCGIQFLGRQEWMSLHPYSEYYKGLKRGSEQEFKELIDKIIGWAVA